MDGQLSKRCPGTGKLRAPVPNGEGAWGCGAFRNDPHRTAQDFRAALETAFSGHFSDIVFAITDWSQTRRYLGPFRDVMTPAQ